MSQPSLAEIEKTLKVLWSSRKTRQQFFDGKARSKRYSGSQLNTLHSDVLSQIDKTGFNVYLGLMSTLQNDLMLSVYPACARLLADKWEDVVGDYYEKYPPAHYNLNQSVRKFAEYLIDYGERYIRQYPFIAELADYEWLELEIMERHCAIQLYSYEPLVDSLQFENTAPVVNPTLSIRGYGYPIPTLIDHLEAGCCLPKDISDQANQTTWMAAYRDPYEHHCRFLELGATTARLVEMAIERTISYRELLTFTVTQGGDPQQSVIEFLDTIEKLQTSFLFVGSAAV